MEDYFRLKEIGFNSLFTIEQLEEQKNIFQIKDKPKKLITGYEVYQVNILFEDKEQISCSFQFQNGRLRYLMVYPDYREFLVEAERWDHPTVDGSVENEACLCWMKKYLSYQIGEKYAWGSIQETFEPWTGKAMLICQFRM